MKTSSGTRPKADIDTECEKCFEQPNPPFETFGEFQLADHHQSDIAPEVPSYFAGTLTFPLGKTTSLR